MRPTLPLLALLAMTSFLCGADGRAAQAPTEITERAVSSDEHERNAAIAALRARGEAGLAIFAAAHREQVEALRRTAPSQWSDRAIRVKSALDGIAAQRDAEHSLLYWHTDLTEAKLEAERTGRLVLSLRLLGALTEELSCANSRYFRTLLYPDSAVQDLLRRRFVLHWQTERPVPIVEIRVPNGALIRTTLTGNSIHYVVRPDGTVLDALPGLYAPGRFRMRLEAVLELAHAMEHLTPAEAERLRRRFITSEQSTAERKAPPALGAALMAGAGGPTAPLVRAERLTASKAMAEDLPVRRIVPRAAPGPTVETRAMLTPIADTILHENGGLRIAAPELVARKIAPRAPGEPVTASDRLRVLADLPRIIAEDTAINELVLRPRVLTYLTDTSIASDVETLNRKIYAEVFEMPASDGYAGLVSPIVFLGVENGAVTR